MSEPSDSAAVLESEGISTSLDQELLQDISDRIAHIESILELGSNSEVGAPVQLKEILHEVKKSNALLGKARTDDTTPLATLGQESTTIKCSDITVRVSDTIVQEYPVREDDFDELRRVSIAGSTIHVVEYSTAHKKERSHIIHEALVTFWS